MFVSVNLRILDNLKFLEIADTDKLYNRFDELMK